ncbi:hypothetical protein ACJX0J_027586, partial [Zea mays]
AGCAAHLKKIASKRFNKFVIFLGSVIELKSFAITIDSQHNMQPNLLLVQHDCNNFQIRELLDCTSRNSFPVGKKHEEDYQTTNRQVAEIQKCDKWVKLGDNGLAVIFDGPGRAASLFWEYLFGDIIRHAGMGTLDHDYQIVANDVWLELGPEG